VTERCKAPDPDTEKEGQAERKFPRPHAQASAHSSAKRRAGTDLRIRVSMQAGLLASNVLTSAAALLTADF
jgi:hypothetical protein